MVLLILILVVILLRLFVLMLELIVLCSVDLTRTGGIVSLTVQRGDD